MVHFGHTIANQGHSISSVGPEGLHRGAPQRGSTEGLHRGAPQRGSTEGPDRAVWGRRWDFADCLRRCCLSHRTIWAQKDSGST